MTKIKGNLADNVFLVGGGFSLQNVAYSSDPAVTLRSVMVGKQKSEASAPTSAIG